MSRQFRTGRLASYLVGLRYNKVMRRCFSIAAFSFILIALPVWAQRGAGGGGHAASHGGVAGHSSGGYHGGSVGRSSGGYHGGSAGRNSGIRLRIGNYYNNRRGYGYRRRGYYPYSGYGGYYPYGDYGWWDDSDTQNDDQDSYSGAYSPVPSYPSSNSDNSGLRSEVQTLGGKIDRLQADVEARARKPEQEPETALVFRDKHVEEVRNYAISGGTLWVLNEQAAKKIPLAQLDIPATVKLNDDRGVDFQVPGPSLQLMIVR